VRILIALFLLWTGSSAFAADDLKSLYNARRWTELYQALQTHGGPPLYRGIVAAVFNEDRLAERLLRSAIRSAPQSEDAYDAYEWLTHIYFRTGRYHKMIETMEARWSAFPDKSETKNEQAALSGFRKWPDQITGKANPSTLPHDPGDTFITATINHNQATYFFDTGGWINCMSESEAKRLGLAVRDTDGSVGTGTGAKVGFRTAVAEEVVIGNIRYKNVSFAVFRDDQEPWSLLPVGRRGLIGIPLILGFRSLRWNRDGYLEIGMKPASANPVRSILFFDDDNMVVSAESQQLRVLATFDTGADTTDLYEPFARQFPDLVKEQGKKDTTEVRGVGHAESFDSFTLPELKFKLGGSEATLKPAHVLMKQLGKKCCIGNFGMDLFKQGRAFRIDFGAMRFDLEP